MYPEKVAHLEFKRSVRSASQEEPSDYHTKRLPLETPWDMAHNDALKAKDKVMDLMAVLYAGVSQRQKAHLKSQQMTFKSMQISMSSL